MKKLLTILSFLFLLTPLSAFASINATWSATSTDKGYISPNLVNGNNPDVKLNGSLTINTLSGILKAVSGVVQTALVDLTADVSGILPVANGGTGAASFTAGTRFVISNGTSAFTSVAAPLTVSNGGTGSTTLSGLLKGNGTGIVATAVPGSDYTLITANTCGAGNHVSAITALGSITCSADSGGSSLLTNVSTNTFLNKGTNLQAPVLMATSTTATSTFAGDLAIGGNNGNPNPYLFIGTSTVYTPFFGRVQGDIIDTEYDWNGQSSINVANANVGSCASATFFADGNNPTLGGYYGTFSFLNDGWTGSGCSIGAGTIDKPEAVAIASPTGEMDFDIASTTNNGSADFNWNVNNAHVMKLTNAGRLGIGTTTPSASVSVDANNTATQKGLSLASQGTPYFTVATSSGTAVNIATSSAIGSNVLTVNGGVYFHGLATGAGNGALCATTDGLVSYDAGANCIVSSLRFKNVDATITPEESLATVLKLSPIFFHYKQGYGDNGKAQQEGFGAEEVALVDKNLVQYDAHGDPFSVFYQNITAKLVGAVQAIWNRLDYQQQEIDTLKAQVKALQDAQQRPLPKQL